MGVNLCLALHGDQGELGAEEAERLRSSRGTSVRGTSGNMATAGAPPRGQPQQAGMLIVPGKHEDNF